MVLLLHFGCFVLLINAMCRIACGGTDTAADTAAADSTDSSAADVGGGTSIFVTILLDKVSSTSVPDHHNNKSVLVLVVVLAAVLAVALAVAFAVLGEVPDI